MDPFLETANHTLLKSFKSHFLGSFFWSSLRNSRENLARIKKLFWTHFWKLQFKTFPNKSKAVKKYFSSKLLTWARNPKCNKTWLVEILTQLKFFFEKLFPAEMGPRMILLRKIIFHCPKQESKSYLFNLFVVNSRGQGNVSGDLETKILVAVKLF